MRVLSWNINGIRAATKKGFFDWLGGCRGQIVGLQETRAMPEQLEEAVRQPARWHADWVAAERKGYSGVGLLTRQKPDHINHHLHDDFNSEGRYQRAEFGDLVVVNAYFPNGSGKNRDHSRIPYKLAFTKAVRDSLVADQKAGRPILVMGDFNTAQEEIDLARPKQNRNKTSGFVDVEREELRAWKEAGFTDTFRYHHPDVVKYSWWSQRFGIREKNVGWRIDYVFASEAAMPFLRRAFILTDVMGSDHCPVGVDVDNAIVG